MLQNIFYRVPESRFFHTLYPQPIVLSAGTSFTLPITFRPLEKLIYEDKVEFITNVSVLIFPLPFAEKITGRQKPNYIISFLLGRKI